MLCAKLKHGSFLAWVAQLPPESFFPFFEALPRAHDEGSRVARKELRAQWPVRVAGADFLSFLVKLRVFSLEIPSGHFHAPLVSRIALAKARCIL